MSEDEMKTMWPGTEEYVDLCGFCLNCDEEEDQEWFGLDSDGYHVEE